MKIYNQIVKLNFIWFICLICATVKVSAANDNIINLAGKWEVALDSTDVGLSAGWEKKEYSQLISLPGTTDESGLGTPNKFEPKLTKPQVLYLTRKNKFIGPVWYAREITIPATWKNKTTIIKLERVLWESQLWVDGKKLAIKQESLVSPHYFDATGLLNPGKHRIVFRIDNRKKYEISVASANSPLGLAHAYTDDTQTIWNGIIGGINCCAYDRVRISDFQIYPDIKNQVAKIKLVLEKNDEKKFDGELNLLVKSIKEDIVLPTKKIRVSFKDKHEIVETSIEMGKNFQQWSETTPYLYKATAGLVGKHVNATETRNFGMRNIGTANSAIQVNGKNVFLRGTLECCIFPQTGHPPMNYSGWEKVFRTAREWGLNHIRFHSWCPPRYAFEVADSMGFYLQIELPLWSLKVNQDSATNRFLYQESERIIQEYGNHPSFCLWSIGNELQKDFGYLNSFVDRLKKQDPRHLYTSTSYTFEPGHGAWSEPTDDYFITQCTKLGWVRGQGVFGAESPSFNKDYSESTKGLTVPLITHEVGQYSVYPNIKEIEKYKGVLDPLNFKAIKNDLEQKGLIAKASDYTLASGKLAAILYKEEIERALKSKNISGYQLLDLHDFPGQGTALVGLLDAFWDSKGIIESKEFREFAAPVVPLVRFVKPVFKNNEVCNVDVEVANYSGSDINKIVEWTLANNNNVLAKGQFQAKNLINGSSTEIGKFQCGFDSIKVACQLTLSVSVNGTNYMNHWHIWVYPSDLIINNEKILYTQSYDEALNGLKAGRKVLYNPDWKKLKGIEGKFLPVFWSPVHFPKQAATMGVLCNPQHPALKEFPTDMHSDWQWWDLNSNSTTIILDSISKVTPIIEMIDNWVNNRKLALAFEAKCGSGKLLYTSIDLNKDLSARPQAKQLLFSLMKYMNSSDFNPQESIDFETLRKFESTNISNTKEKPTDIY